MRSPKAGDPGLSGLALPRTDLAAKAETFVGVGVGLYGVSQVGLIPSTIASWQLRAGVP